MQISLKNKKALIGGASSGLGKAIAIQLARCGAQITVIGRNQVKLDAVVKKLDAINSGGNASLLTDYNDFQSYQNDISKFFEGNQVDILVNNTQGPNSGNVFDKTADDYQKACDLLFQVAVYTSTLALKGMLEKRSGRIINLSSMTVKEPQNQLVLSNTMRAALCSWSKSLSNEVADRGVTVNSILTGFFDTERLKELAKNQSLKSGMSVEEIENNRLLGIPAKRLGQVEEYGHLVAFLASEYSSYITGAAIPIDGGVANPFI